MIKGLKRVGLSVLVLAVLQVSAFADDAWNNFKNNAKNAGENSTISVPSDLQADGTSAGFLQKNLKIDFNNHTIKGSNYTSEAPLIFSGAGGQSDTKMAIENAIFTGFNVGDNGILNNTNPHLELTDVSFTNNIGRAINNNAYNQLIISAINNNVTISNDYLGDGIYSKSSIYLNASDNTGVVKTLRIDDNIKIESSIDGNLNINNTFKNGGSLRGIVFLNGKIDISGQVILGANVGYDNGTLKLGVTPANSDNFKLFVGGEAILDLQNDNVDALTMGLLKGNDESSPLHLKLDYNAQTGKMDIINVENSAVGGSPSLIVDEINILVGGNATNTNYISGGGRNLIKVSKDTLTAVKDGKTYIFKPDTARGSYKVSKAKNILDLPTYIQTAPPTNEKEVAITSDIVLNTDLGTLFGTDRETTIYGNGHTINGKADYNGVSVDNGQKFGFNNIKLSNFKDYAIKNNGEVKLTSVKATNANIINTGTLNLYGENAFTSRIGGDEHGNKVGKINVLSGTTNIGQGLFADKLNIGSDDTNIPRATFKNNGHSQVNTVTIKSANLVNEKVMETDKIITNNAKIRNDGDYLLVRDSLNISSDSILENTSGVIGGGGNIINYGKIINNGGKIEGNQIDNYGEITSDGDRITNTISMKDDNAIYNITGGSLNDSTKINGSQGNVYISGEVMVGAEDFQDFTGKTTVKSGAELVITSVMPEVQNTLFSQGDLIFEDNSTLNLINSASYLDNGMKNDNIVINAGDTLNLKINDKSKLKFINYAKREGNISITELEFRQDSPTSWTVIEDDLNEIYRRTSLADNFKLIKRYPTAQVNYVMYDNTNGTMNLGNTNLNDLLKTIEQTRPSKEYFYDISSDENLDTGILLYDDNSTVIVQGNNKTLNFENNARLDFGSQTGKNRIVFNNLNMENAYLGPDSEGQLVINNDSGNTITLNNTTIDDRSLNGGTKFTGNSDINFNGEYINTLNRSNTKVHVDLNGATLTKNGADSYANWNLNSGTLKYLNDSHLANGGNNSIYFNGGNLDLRNSIASEIPLANLGLSANSNIYVDVDLANKTMDKLTTNNFSHTDGKLNVAGMTLLSDANDDVTTINFTNDSNLMGNVEYTGTKTVAYSPIFKYNVSYDNTNGDFTFSRGNGGSGGNPSSAFNPAILSTPVAAQVGAYLTQLNTYEQAFANQDMLMSMTNEQRTAMKFANKLASTQGTGEGGVITFSPNQIPEEDKGLWFRPFATFENVGLKNGPNVKNIGYGTLVGGDSGIVELKHGWDAIYSGYVGYNGSNQYYDGVSVTQNGGTVGLSGIWYKNNFFTGLTANVGASVGEASTMFGNDEFAMLSTGVASKTGYNWELADGKFIIQPSFLMSYSFVNTFDYTNSAGVKINSDPLHAIQIAPGLKFIGNLKNGWQPYVSLQMVWNLIDKTRFHANNVSLPDMSVDPYFQYGVGLQKRIGERFTGFGQAMIRNGGRNGIALQFGFRWALGK